MVAASVAVAQTVEDVDIRLTPTQPVSCALERPCSPPSAVCARLVAFAGSAATYELTENDRELAIGRHHSCQILVTDRRASGKHLRIYREDLPQGCCYMIDQLSSNNCFVNEHCLRKGCKRRLQHGDHISLCMYAHETREKPFAAFVFQIASESHPLENRIAASVRPKRPGAESKAAVFLPGLQPVVRESRSHIATDEWVRDTWDLSTVLGSGGFSDVRLGIRLDSGSRRAVKVIDKAKFVAFRRTRESHLTLRSEADMLTGLEHPGVVRFYEWFETDSRLYLVMELLEGGDLLDFILEHGCIAENSARRLFGELCEAVGYLHGQGVVHRDLKPENVMLTSRTEDAHAKVVDFGLARKNVKSRDCRTFCGTPQYFAPEVISTFKDRAEDGSAGYGTQVDSWSLGVILYVMLSGSPPFDDEDGRLYRRILEGKFEFDVPQWQTVSSEAKDLVRGLLSVNPKERLTVQQTLEHPWLRSAVSPPSLPPPPPLASSAASDSRTNPANVMEPVRLDFGAAAGEETPMKRRRTSLA